MGPEGGVHTDPWDFFQSSPAIADGVVYFGTGEGMLYALDAQTGDERWVFETADTIHSSPAIADGTVYVGNMESRLYAVDAANGKVQYKFGSSDLVEGRLTADVNITTAAGDSYSNRNTLSFEVRKQV